MKLKKSSIFKCFIIFIIISFTNPINRQNIAETQTLTIVGYFSFN